MRRIPGGFGEHAGQGEVAHEHEEPDGSDGDEHRGEQTQEVGGLGPLGEVHVAVGEAGENRHNGDGGDDDEVLSQERAEGNAPVELAEFAALLEDAHDDSGGRHGHRDGDGGCGSGRQAEEHGDGRTDGGGQDGGDETDGEDGHETRSQVAPVHVHADAEHEDDDRDVADGVDARRVLDDAERHGAKDRAGNEVARDRGDLESSERE